VQYREELILIISVFIVKTWVYLYREERIRNVNLFVVSVWVIKYKRN